MGPILMSKGPRHLKFRVDLKWSLWLNFPESWSDYAPGVIPTLQSLRMGETVEIVTAPRKEIRCGVVTITKTTKGYEAVGDFHAEWDEEWALADTLEILSGEDELTDNDHHAIETLRETVPRNDNGDPGTSVSFSVKARDLDTLFNRIDNQEARLLKENNEAWEMFERDMNPRKVKT